MKSRNRRGAAALLLSVGLGAASPAASAAEEPALRRVLLTTGGVGYFEHEARVAGDADLQLSVPLDQVSDVLKSIVVFDDRGRIGQVSLPGREALREVFRDLPFSQEDLGSLVSLLRALRGAEVRITAPGATIEGRLVAVIEETTALPEGREVTRHRITVSTAAGIRQAILEETTSIQFVDERLQAQLERALAAMGAQGEREQRTLSIHVMGQGERLVRIGYVVEAPLWKATYRLALGQAPGQAALQGWAVVENMSGKEWDNVDLTVVSGNPVTFRQALYEAYYVTRPEVPVEVLGRILPRIDVGAVQPTGGAEIRSLARFAALSADGERAEAALAAAPARAPALAELLTAAGAEAMTQAVFRFPSIDIAVGQTALLPMVSGPIAAERVSLYQPETQPLHPLASVRLTNNTGTSLPPGAVSIYESSAEGGGVSYLGDAQMGPLPAGEDRLLSYAVDLKVRVDREELRASVLTNARIVDGILLVTRTERRETRYTIAGATDEPRVVVLEHPRVAGFTLVEPAGAVISETPEDYRIRTEVPAGQTVAVRAVLERPIEQRVELLTIAPNELAVFVAAPQLPEGVRATLARVQELQQAVATRQAAVARLEQERAGIVADQARIRENLRAVPPESDLYRRYLATLAEQENRLAALRGEIEAAQAAVQAAREALASFIRGLGS